MYGFVGRLGYIDSLLYKQVNSWKELEDKVVVLAHLD